MERERIDLNGTEKDWKGRGQNPLNGTGPD